MASYTLANNGLDHAFFFMIPIYYINQCWLISNDSGYIHLTVCNFIYAQDIMKMHWKWCILSLKPHFPKANVLKFSYRKWWYWPTRHGPIFCLLLWLWVSSDYAQPITGHVTEVIGQAQPGLTQKSFYELLKSLSDKTTGRVEQHEIFDYQITHEKSDF